MDKENFSTHIAFIFNQCRLAKQTDYYGHYLLQMVANKYLCFFSFFVQTVKAYRLYIFLCRIMRYLPFMSLLRLGLNKMVYAVVKYDDFVISNVHCIAEHHLRTSSSYRWTEFKGKSLFVCNSMATNWGFLANE